jgi:hypothetical protein
VQRSGRPGSRRVYESSFISVSQFFEPLLGVVGNSVGRASNLISAPDLAMVAICAQSPEIANPGCPRGPARDACAFFWSVGRWRHGGRPSALRQITFGGMSAAHAPLALSDAQMDAVLAAAAPLPVAARDRFLPILPPRCRARISAMGPLSHPASAWPNSPTKSLGCLHVYLRSLTGIRCKRCLGNRGYCKRQLSALRNELVGPFYRRDNRRLESRQAKPSLSSDRSASIGGGVVETPTRRQGASKRSSCRGRAPRRGSFDEAQCAGRR